MSFKQFYAVASATASALVVFSASGKPGAYTNESTAIEKRNGDAEAERDIAEAKETRLYWSIENGRGPGYLIPGIVDCDPQYKPGNKSVLFVPLPEADFQEPSQRPPEYESAVNFARLYNQAMFLARTSDVLRVCPKAKLAN